MEQVQETWERDCSATTKRVGRTFLRFAMDLQAKRVVERHLRKRAKCSRKKTHFDFMPCCAEANELTEMCKLAEQLLLKKRLEMYRLTHGRDEEVRQLSGVVEDLISKFPAYESIDATTVDSDTMHNLARVQQRARDLVDTTPPGEMNFDAIADSIHSDLNAIASGGVAHNREEDPTCQIENLQAEEAMWNTEIERLRLDLRDGVQEEAKELAKKAHVASLVNQCKSLQGVASSLMLRHGKGGLPSLPAGGKYDAGQHVEWLQAFTVHSSELGLGLQSAEEDMRNCVGL